MVSGGWILMEAHLASQNHGGTIKNDKKLYVAFSGWSKIRDSNRAEMEAFTEGLFYSKTHVPPLIAEGDPQNSNKGAQGDFILPWKSIFNVK